MNDPIAHIHHMWDHEAITTEQMLSAVCSIAQEDVRMELLEHIIIMDGEMSPMSDLDDEE